MNTLLTKQELEDRKKDSLIKYIGVLQAELSLVYENHIKKDLDFSDTDTLKSTS